MTKAEITAEIEAIAREELVRLHGVRQPTLKELLEMMTVVSSWPITQYARGDHDAHFDA